MTWEIDTGTTAVLYGVLVVMGTIVPALLAQRKGYFGLFWLFAGGPIGLVTLAFLSDLSFVAEPSAKQAAKSRGNWIGIVLTAATMLACVLAVLLPMAFNTTSDGRTPPGTFTWTLRSLVSSLPEIFCILAMIVVGLRWLPKQPGRSSLILSAAVLLVIAIVGGAVVNPFVSQAVRDQMKNADAGKVISTLNSVFLILNMTYSTLRALSLGLLVYGMSPRRESDT